MINKEVQYKGISKCETAGKKGERCKSEDIVS